MKISIIIPCYNGANFIVKTLESVAKQSYQNWECIVIDDGSKDDSKQVVQNYIESDNRFIYYYQENKGLSGARNTGMNIASGAYLYFLDADDLIADYTIENLVNLTDKTIDIVYGKTAITNGQNTDITGYLDHKLPTLQNLSNYNKQLLVDIQKDNLVCTAHNKLYKTSFLHQNKLTFQDGLLHEDELWFFESFFLSKNVILNDKPTYFYNVSNDESIINNMTSKNIEAYLNIIETIYQKYYLNHENVNYTDQISAYITRLKQVCIHFYKNISTTEQEKCEPQIATLFKNINPKRNKRIFSKKIEKKLYKFCVISQMPPNEIIAYQNKPKNPIKKVLRKLKFYRFYLKNKSLILENYSI